MSVITSKNSYCHGLTQLQQKNDFALKAYHETETYHQVWLETTGDRGKDIRARRFTGEISKLTTPLVSQHLRNTHTPIFRVVYNCLEACCRDLDQEHEDENADRQRRENDVDDSGDSDETETEDEGGGKKTPMKRKRATNDTRMCDVILHVSCGMSSLRRGSIKPLS